MDIVKLTPAQIRCLLVGPWATGFGLADTPLVVEQGGGDDWIVVKDAAKAHEEGAGVWVDPYGVVHYSPGGGTTTSDPWPASVLDVDEDTETLHLRIQRQ